MRKELASENPLILREWDYERNGEHQPSDFAGGSDYKAWWKCKLGHSWKTAIKYRTIGTNCPYCAGKKVWVGFNDLATTHPHLAEEWHYEKNGDLRPEHVTASSNKKVWWLCNSGHSWIAMINNRKKGQGCPYDVGRRVWLGFNDLPTTNPQIADEWDYSKNNGLIPEQFTNGSKKRIWWKCKNGHSWRAVIYSRIKHGCPICYGKNTFVPGVNDLSTVNSELAAEWDYEKNGDLRPENVSANTHTKVWWRCKLHHSWQAKISNRNNDAGCPYCTNRLVLKGFNDLLSVNPTLCKEWDYEKNSPIQPDEITIGSNKKVWWKCAKGHSYKARVPDRRKGNGCSVCAGKIVIAGDNDLKTLCPNIAGEWDYERNGSLRPEHVTVQATSKVWWLCKKGHSYMSRVYNRYNGNSCPYCSGNLPIIGETDLATIHPELLKEWDDERNGDKKPSDFTCGSNKKVHWKCKRGHRFLASISSRTIGTKCPRCSGKTQMRTRLV